MSTTTAMTATTDPGAVASEIYRCNSLAEIKALFQQYSAESTGYGASLYGGQVGEVRASQIVKQIQDGSNLPLVERTQRGELLSNDQVSAAVLDRAAQIFRRGGATVEDAKTLGADFLFGDPNALTGPTSIPEALWGETSQDFVSSVRGPIQVASVNSPEFKTLGRVEIDAALANPNVTSIGDIPIADLRADQAAHGTAYVVDRVQQSFRADAASEIFVKTTPSGAFEPVLSEDIARKFGITGPYQTAAQLRADGLPNVDLSLSPVALTPNASTLTPGLDVDALAARGAEAFAGESSAVTVGGLLKGAGIAATVAITVYQAAQTKQQYDQLEAASNDFAATNLVRTQAIETGASLVGAIAASAATDAALSAIGGSETGPFDVLIAAGGGVVGGVGALIGGEAYARHLTEEKVDQNTGADGKTYTYENGAWEEKKGHLWWKSESPAPASQIPSLDMSRTTKLTDLAMSHPTTIDPNKIDATDPRTGQMVTWQRLGPSGTWSAVGVDPASCTPPGNLADALTRESVQRTLLGTNGADVAAKGFLTDYYGKGWTGPLPDSVTHQLGLPSETHVADPATGKAYLVSGNLVLDANLPSSLDDIAKWQQGSPPDVTSRVLAARNEAVASNQLYGANLVQQQAVIATEPISNLQSTQAPFIGPLAPGESAPGRPATSAPPTLSPGDPEFVGPVVAGQPVPTRPDPPTLSPGDKGFIGPVVGGQPSPTRPDPPTLSPGDRGFIGPVVEQPVGGAKPASFARGDGSASSAQAAVFTTSAQTDPKINVSPSPARYNGDSDDLATVGDALRTKVATLRLNGTYLPDVTSVQPYTSRTQTGTFVQVAPDTVAQYVGQGTYQVASISRDLNGLTPPLGQVVTISPPPTQSASNPAGPPAIASPVPTVVTPAPAHSYGRMM